MTSIIIAYLHHLSVFTILSCLIAELYLLSDEINASRILSLARIDAFFGLSSLSLVIFGFLRVNYFEKGFGFYSNMTAFWIKISLFLVIGLISIFPTINFIKWKRQLKSEPKYLPSSMIQSKMKKFVILELILLVPIPLLAIMMSRGFF